MDNTDEDISHGQPSDPLHAQERRTSVQSSILDSEDDLFLGTDAQVYLASRKPLLSATSSDSVCTGLHYEASNESSGVSGSCRVIKKLAHVGRHESSESLISDCSNFSRSSHDVISLLNAMTVDPEEFLADLGFAEPDMRSRIPDRFLESPSSARGIDVDFFRRSLDQDDSYGSPTQESSVWSDPGSCRIPLRFITSCAEPVNPELSESYTSVPLISEPEEALEDSFDLMRHLRLNKPCHVTKGMFLEPVTEEIEVSSVGSGTVRTKISRRLSNEEGTIVREESFEQANVESELLLDLPDVETADKGQESNEFTEEKGPKNENNESLIVVTIAQEGNNGSLPSKGFVTANSANFSDDDAVNLSDDRTKIDYDKSHVSVDLVTKEDEEISPILPRLAHLKVASVSAQDSFELEEIASEEFNEKESSSSTDPEAGLNIKSPEKRLTRENSGESSGFEEIMTDKDTLSPSSCSPKLNAKRFSADAYAIDSDSRTPWAALLDPEMLSLAAEKARVSDHFVDEKSPRAAFAQRRSRSLTKQRPVDEDMLASYVYSPSSSTPKETADLDRSLQMKGNHVASSEDLGPIFSAASAKIQSNIDSSNSGPEFLGMTDENCNALLKTEPEMTVCEESEIKFGRTRMADESFEGQPQNNQVFLSDGDDGRAAVSQSEFGSSDVAITSEESILQSSLVSTDNISERRFENNDQVHLTTDGSENNLRSPGNSIQLGVETEGSRDGLASGENVFASHASATAESTEAVGACALINQEEPKEPLRKFDSDFQQHYLHEINVLEKSIQKYESTLSSGGPLDAMRSVYTTKHMLTRITEEMEAIQELRLLVNSELERMKHLLAERRNMLLAGAARDPVGSGVSQKMADLLREQSSLNIGLSSISDELSIRKKASRRARIHSHIESAKRELKEERETCIREFREEIKEALVRELSEKFCSEIDSLRQEVRIKDELIEQLKKSQDQRESGD